MKKNNYKVKKKKLPKKLTRWQERKLQKMFPEIPVVNSIEAIKNYDNVVDELNLKKTIEKELIETNSKKEKRIFEFYKENVRLQNEIIRLNEENKILEEKNKTIEEKRRKTAGKIGGLTAKNNSLEKEKALYKKMLDEKEEGLKKTKEIIDELNKKIKQLKNRPTMSEIYEYERTRKSPKKKNEVE